MLIQYPAHLGKRTFFFPHWKESKGKRQTIFRTSLHFFGRTFDEEKLPDDYTLPEKVHYDNNRKRYQDIVSWEKHYLVHKIEDFHSCKRSHFCPQIASTEWSLQTEIDFCLKDSQRHDASKVTLKCNWHSQQQRTLCDDVSTSSRKLDTDKSDRRDVKDKTTDDQSMSSKYERHSETVNSKLNFE